MWSTEPSKSGDSPTASTLKRLASNKAGFESRPREQFQYSQTSRSSSCQQQPNYICRRSTRHLRLRNHNPTFVVPIARHDFSKVYFRIDPRMRRPWYHPLHPLRIHRETRHCGSNPKAEHNSIVISASMRHESQS
jgi:hypothetical protein